MYEIEIKDFYKDINGDVEDKFHINNSPEDHVSMIPTGKNKKVVGMMKDEAGKKIVECYFGSRAQLHSYKMCEGKEEKKCKGIEKVVIKENITHEDYKECLFRRNMQMRKMNVVRSHKHEVATKTINKIALSANDDKRIIREDKIST